MSRKAGLLKERWMRRPGGPGWVEGRHRFKLWSVFVHRVGNRAAIESPTLTRRWKAGQLRSLQRSPWVRLSLLSVIPDTRAACNLYRC